MYPKITLPKTQILRNLKEDGETIEEKVRRIMTTKEPITDGAPLIYTDRSEGVVPDYDPRTDKWEYAVTAMDQGAKNQLAKRKELLTPPAENPDQNQQTNSGDPKP